MIDYWLMIFFNLLFTSVPPIMFGILDSDLSAEMLLGIPELYRTGQGAGVSTIYEQKTATCALRVFMTLNFQLVPVSIQQYNLCTFWVSILDAFYQSLVAFFVPYLVNNT